MLGRKTYEPEELANARAALRARLNAWDDLAKATTDPGAQEALDSFEPLFFNSLVLVLDRDFVHRLRTATGKDNNALNEVELLTESLMNNDGVLRTGNVVKYDPATSVTGIAPGQPISLDRDGFERLSDAFFVALEERFLV
jgi:hypothetical protein